MKDIRSEVEKVLPSIDLASHKYEITLKTSEGDIVLETFPEKAPNHVKNMIALAKAGFYDGLIFHRVINGFMIQGGCPEGSGMGGPGYKVDAEFNDVAHEPGVLSMARAQDPNSAGSQFFICLERVPHLDGQYTAFGRTKDQASLDVVRKIGDVATGIQDRPTTDVIINEVSVTEAAL